MFVNRPNRPLPPIENAQESKSSPGDVDFITKHGGMYAICCVMLLCFVL